MKWKTAALALSLFLALSAGSTEAEWTLGPGLAPPLPTNPAFSTKGWQEGTMNVNIPVSKDENLLKRARINRQWKWKQPVSPEPLKKEMKPGKPRAG